MKQTSKRPPEPQAPGRRALGRGLDGLLPPTPTAAAPVKPSPSNKVPIEKVHPNLAQPRRRFEEEALDDLATSLKEIGFLEPILVRTRKTGGGFEIIAGERRWRAAQRAGLKEVPVFIRELNPSEAFEAALVENIQREELNPIETARAFERLIDEHGYSQEHLADRIGKNRSTIANGLRLLKLPAAVIDMLETGELSEGHGRALLAAQDKIAIQQLAQKAIDQGWSVRETERQAKAFHDSQKAGNQPSDAPQEKSANVRDLERRLTQKLGTKVLVADRKGKGHLKLAFSSYEDLDRLLEQLL